MRGAIADAGATVDFRPIIEWPQVALTRKSIVKQLLHLDMLQPTTPLVDGKLTRHNHQVLTHHLPRIDSALQRVQGSLIATHTRKVATEMRRDQEKKDRVRERTDSKGFPELLGTNLTYLLRL